MAMVSRIPPAVQRLRDDSSSIERGHSRICREEQQHYLHIDHSPKTPVLVTRFPSKTL